jgi:hypothetical protein
MFVKLWHLIPIIFLLVSDLEFESDVDPSAPEPAQYETAYVTSHKSPCRAGAFSIDGQLCATGSVDASIKVSISMTYPSTNMSMSMILKIISHLQDQLQIINLNSSEGSMPPL